MTHVEAGEWSATIASSFLWPALARIVGHRIKLDADVFAVVLPGSTEDEVNRIEFCFRQALHKAAPDAIVVVHSKPPKLDPADGWTELT